MGFREIFSGVKDLFQALPTVSRSEWRDTRQVDPRKPTIILVSGFGANSRNLSAIRKRFIKDGFNVLVLALDWHQLSDSFKGFYLLAESLSALVTSLRKKKGMQQAEIYLVAHSAGGLVCRYYIQSLGGWYFTNGLITLATPHQGTWLALLGFLTHMILKGRCLFQLLPFSPFIRYLNKTVFPEDFPMVSFFSRDDILCRPANARLGPGLISSPHVESEELRHLSHGGFLVSKRCYAKVMFNLKLWSRKDHPQGVSA